MRNTLYFCSKYKSLDCYLFLRWCLRKLELADANTLLNLAEGEPAVMAELLQMYGRFAYDYGLELEGGGSGAGEAAVAGPDEQLQGSVGRFGEAEPVGVGGVPVPVPVSAG